MILKNRTLVFTVDRSSHELASVASTIHEIQPVYLNISEKFFNFFSILRSFRARSACKLSICGRAVVQGNGGCTGRAASISPDRRTATEPFLISPVILRAGLTAIAFASRSFSTVRAILHLSIIHVVSIQRTDARRCAIILRRLRRIHSLFRPPDNISQK